MLPLSNPKALSYSQLSRCLVPPDKDRGPNLRGIMGKALCLKHSFTSSPACTAESGFTQPLCFLQSHLFGNNIPGSKPYFLEEPLCCVLQKKMRRADSLNLSCLQNTCKSGAALLPQGNTDPPSGTLSRGPSESPRTFGFYVSYPILCGKLS